VHALGRLRVTAGVDHSDERSPLLERHVRESNIYRILDEYAAIIVLFYLIRKVFNGGLNNEETSDEDAAPAQDQPVRRRRTIDAAHRTLRGGVARANPGAKVIVRDIGREPVPHLTPSASAHSSPRRNLTPPNSRRS